MVNTDLLWKNLLTEVLQQPQSGKEFIRPDVTKFKFCVAA